MKKTAPAAPARRPSAFAAAPAETEPGIGPGAAAGIYFGLALLYFLPALLPGRMISGTDYLNAGYFFYDFISQRTADGALPGWVPYVYGGVPLFSNPGSTYYPVRWVADLLGPTSLFFPLLFVFQFGIAGLGTYLLARELGCRRWVAFVAGVAFQWTGILTSWVYAGHDGRIIVVTLAPLFFWAIHAGVRTAALRYFVALAATTAFVLLSFQIQNAYYLLLAGVVWAVFCLVRLGAVREPRRLAAAAGLGIAAVAFGFVTASVNFLPFMDYVGQSPRGQTEGRGWEFSTSYSMPARAVVGLAVPEQVGATIQNDRGEYVFPIYRGENPFRLHTEYVGATVLVLVALGAWYARRNRYFWFFAGLGVFALTLALGGNTPLYRLYYEALPGIKRFRAPDLAYYVLAFSLVAMAALALERLAQVREAARADAARRAGAGERSDDDPAKVLWIALGVVGVSVLGAVALGAPAAGMAEGTSGLAPAAGWMRFALFAALAGGAVWLWMGGRMSSRAAMIALAVVTTADLWIIGKKFLVTVPAPSELYAADDVASFFQRQAQAGPSRIFPVPGQSGWPPFIDYPMHFDLELASGEHGNQLQRYNEYLGAGENSYVDYHNFLADPRFWHGANVRWLVTSAPVEAPFLREAYRGSTALVYENLLAQPRAYLAPEVTRVADAGQTLAWLQSPAWDPARSAVVESPRELGVGTGPLQGGARITSYQPDEVRVAVEASRPALLVLADNYYKDWRATVDGRPAEIHRTNHTFRGVVVPAGRHEVRFTFEPADLRTGFWIYVFCLALLAAYAVYFVVTTRRRRHAAPTDAGPATEAPRAE